MTTTADVRPEQPRTRRRAHPRTVAGLLAVAAAIAVLVWGRAEPELRWGGEEPGGPGFGVALDAVGTGESWLVGTVSGLCQTGSPDGPAEVTAVRALQPRGGFSVDAFAVVVHRTGAGTTSTGAEAGVLPADRAGVVPAEAVCADGEGAQGGIAAGGPYTELVLQVSRSGEGPGSTTGVLVEYRVDGTTDSFELPLDLWLCPGPTALGTTGCAS